MIAIDFEASSLVDGYPVSVGIAASDGRMLYRLIKPHPEWEAMRWSPVSEQIHGLSQDQLAAIGIEPSRLMEELNEVFAGETLVSDNPPFEWQWLQVLVEYAGPAHFSLSTVSASEILTTTASARSMPIPILRAIERAISRMARHNALLDAAAWIAGHAAVDKWAPVTTEAEIDAVFDDWEARAQACL